MTATKDMKGNTRFRSAKQPNVVFFFGEEDTLMYFERYETEADGLLYCVLDNDIRFSVAFTAKITPSNFSNPQAFDVTKTGREDFKVSAPVTISTTVELTSLLIGHELNQSVDVGTDDNFTHVYSESRQKHIEYKATKADRERIIIALTNIIKVSAIGRKQAA